MTSDTTNHADTVLDAALVEALRKNGAETVNEQLSAFRPTLVRVALAILKDRTAAEDMAQAALLKFVSYVRDVDTDIRNPAGLATTIVRNLCIGVLRRRARRKRPFSLSSLVLEDGTPIELAADVVAPDEALDREERIQRLRKALLSLKPRQREVLRGLFWEGKTQEAVARALRITVRSVYNLREKALAELMERLNEE